MILCVWLQLYLHSATLPWAWRVFWFLQVDPWKACSLWLMNPTRRCSILLYIVISKLLIRYSPQYLMSRQILFFLLMFLWWPVFIPMELWLHYYLKIIWPFGILISNIHYCVLIWSFIFMINMNAWIWVGSVKNALVSCSRIHHGKSLIINMDY